MIPTVKPEWADDTESWQRRLLRHVKYNQSIIGMIVIGMLKVSDKFGAPAVGDQAVIDPQGRVLCAYLDLSGNFRKEYHIAGIVQLVMELRKIADEVKLDDADRKELFRIARQWIRKDWRLKPNGELYDG